MGIKFSEVKATAQLEHDIAADCAEARRQARRAAERGTSPLRTFDKKTIDQIFHGHEDELNDTIALANRVRAERDAQHERSQRAIDLSRETRKVLDEWKQAEEDKLKGKAQAEARRRLGMDAA